MLAEAKTGWGVSREQAGAPRTKWTQVLWEDGSCMGGVPKAALLPRGPRGCWAQIRREHGVPPELTPSARAGWGTQGPAVAPRTGFRVGVARQGRGASAQRQALPSSLGASGRGSLREQGQWADPGPGKGTDRCPTGDSTEPDPGQPHSQSRNLSTEANGLPKSQPGNEATSALGPAAPVSP